MRILGICGSLQASSSNLALLQAAVRVAPAGVELVVGDLLRELPLFNPELEAAGVPPAVAVWRRALSECDAVLIASPEYGHSLTGALKNGIDWVIGSGELYGKVVATTSVAAQLDRGRRGLQALGQTLRAVDAVVVGESPILRGPGLEAAVRELVNALVDRAAEGQS